MRLATSLLITSALASASPAPAQVSPASLVATMRAIGAAWSRIAQNGESFITKCPAGGFAALRLAPRSTVSLDLRKTDSLLNPFMGIVSITGEFQNNASKQDGSCYPTVEAAQASPTFWGNDMSYSFQLTYKSDGKALSLADADKRFMTNGGNALMRVTRGTHPDWSVVLSTPIQIAPRP